MKEFFVIRILNEDKWFAHKGHDVWTTKKENIHVFKGDSTERTRHINHLAKQFPKLKIVAEKW